MARPVSSVTSLQGHHSKEYIQDRLNKEKKLKGSSDNIKMPAFIIGDDIAEKEFNRIVEELKKVDLVTNVDSTILGLYADSYSKYYESTLALRNEPLVLENISKSGTTNAVPNPFIKIQQQYAAMLMKISSMYGLDPASRSKLAHLDPSDKEVQEDKLKEILSIVK